VGVELETIQVELDAANQCPLTFKRIYPVEKRADTIKFGKANALW
jgi:hypothetical protein